jgi:hypothetical protein
MGGAAGAHIVCLSSMPPESEASRLVGAPALVRALALQCTHVRRTLPHMPPGRRRALPLPNKERRSLSRQKRESSPSPRYELGLPQRADERGLDGVLPGLTQHAGQGHLLDGNALVGTTHHCCRKAVAPGRTGQSVTLHPQHRLARLGRGNIASLLQDPATGAIFARRARDTARGNGQHYQSRSC